MDTRDDHSPSPVPGPSFKLHPMPLLPEGSGYDDPQLEHGKHHQRRASRDFHLNHSKDPSPASSTEQFPQFEDSPYPYPTPTPRWKRLSISRPSFYVWARRLRIGAEKVADGSLFAIQAPGRKRRSLHCVLFLLALALMMLGVVQCLTITFGAIAAFFPDDSDWILEHWGDPGQPSEGLSRWPTDITGDIRPVACHSHNDYWRKVPLYEAIHAGCISIEADVWLFDQELYVGHDTYALTPNRTLNSLYINPLLDILEKQNPVTRFQPVRKTPPHGVFDEEPSQTLVLLIDFKTSGEDLWPYVAAQLSPLREKGYLTYFNGTGVVEGPVTVVGTGNTPFDLLVSNTTYRDIFFDAPLDQLADNSQPFEWHAPHFDGESEDDTYIDTEVDPNHTLPPSIHRLPSPFRRSNDAGQGHSGSAPTNPTDYTPLNTYYASVSFQKSIGHVWRYRLSTKQLDLIRAQIRGAHDRGLKVRYYELPSWPRGLRNHVWHVLVREGVDVLNVDDLNGATRRDWRRRREKGWWY